MSQSSNNKQLIYTGDGENGEWLPDVPARDLSLSEARACGYSPDELVATGLYRLHVEEPDPQPQPHQQSAKPKAASNKKTS